MLGESSRIWISRECIYEEENDKEKRGGEKCYAPLNQTRDGRARQGTKGGRDNGA